MYNCVDARDAKGDGAWNKNAQEERREISRGMAEDSNCRKKS
jgi:hypothetical protein